MKKLSVIIMALALVMGFTQCKKDNLNDNGNASANGLPVLEGQTFNISLGLGTASNAKADVDPFDELGIATVQYTAGGLDKPADKIYVAYQGKYVGVLTCTAVSTTEYTGAVPDHDTYKATFTGSITLDPAETGDQKLYFYFLGSQTPSFTNENGTLTVNLSDQTAGLPVISYAASQQDFSTEASTYTVENNWLMNQCALVKFTCENIYNQSANGNDNNPDAIYTTGRAITLHGFENQVTIDLSRNEFAWGTSDTKGSIKLYMPASDTTVRYAIVHQGNYKDGDLEVAFTPKTVTVGSETIKADPYGFFGTFKFNAEGSTVTVNKNDYYPSAKIDLVWHSGAISVSNNQQVVFTRGNLQYKKSDNTWRLAKHQYDWVGGMVGSSSGHQNDLRQGNVVLLEGVEGNTAYSQNEGIDPTNTSYQGWIDLFGWATGDRPQMTSTTNLDYTRWRNALTADGTTWEDHDWGKNDILNSGKRGVNAGWRTISHLEWAYIIGGTIYSKRTNAAHMVGWATVNNVHGIVILPDAWNMSSFPHGTWKDADADHTVSANVFTLQQWKTMENRGAVFLPCAGRRNGTDYDGGSYSAQDYGVYQASDCQGPDASYALCFGYEIVDDQVNPMMGAAPDNGHSVRLVYNVK